MSKKFFTSILLSLAVFLNGWYIVYAALGDNINAYYKFDSGALTTDSVAGTYTLTNVNTVGETASGLIGYGADYGSANTNKALRRSDLIGISNQADFSVSFWAKIQAEPASGVVYSLWFMMFGYTPSGTYHSLQYVNAGGTLKLGIVGSADDRTTQTLGTTDWHHFVYVYDYGAGTPRTLYLDGVSFDTDTDFTGNYAALGTSFTLGQRYYTGVDDYYSSIFMDEVAVWSRVLTADEVTSLYNAGAGFQYPFTEAGASPASITSDLILFE